MPAWNACTMCVPDCLYVDLQWWEKLLVNLTVLGVVMLIAYGAYNQVAKLPALLNSFIA